MPFAICVQNIRFRVWCGYYSQTHIYYIFIHILRTKNHHLNESPFNCLLGIIYRIANAPFTFYLLFSFFFVRKRKLEKDLIRRVKGVRVRICRRFEAIKVVSISMFFDYYIFNVIAIFMNIINFSLKTGSTHCVWARKHLPGFSAYNIYIYKYMAYVCVWYIQYLYLFSHLYKGDERNAKFDFVCIQARQG